MARALDLVGDRWTLLVVRELFAGPRRFLQLQRGLPGISPNLLTERLRRLAQAGLVESTITARSRSYALTEQGRQLGPVIVGLAHWGTQWLEPHGDEVFRSEWAAFSLAAALAPDRPEQPVAVTVGEHRVEIGSELSAEPALELDCDAMTAYELASGRLDPGQVDTDERTADAIRHRLRSRPSIQLTIQERSADPID